MNIKNAVVFSLVFSIALFFGCNGDEKQNDTLELAGDITTLDFQQTAATETISVQSNTQWTVTVSPAGEWLSVAPPSGSGNASVTVSVTANSGALRTGTVTIKTESGISKEVTVNQLGLEPDIIVSPATAAADPEGDEIDVSITATGAWTIGALPGWIALKSSVMQGAQQGVVLEIDPNDTNVERSAIITFSLDGTDKTAPITITQAPIPGPDFSDLPATVSAGETITLTGTKLDEINELWFGATKGEIEEEGKTETQIDVLIPEDATLGEVEVKVVYGDNKEKVVGTITITPAQPDVTGVPEKAPTNAQFVYLSGARLQNIDKVWFGVAEGEILAGGTATLIKVKPPASVTGTVELKITVGGADKTLGNLEFYAPDPEVDLARYAGSSLPDVPTVTSGRNIGINTNGRHVVFAFDGVTSNAAEMSAGINYHELYVHVISTISDWLVNEPLRLFGTNNRTFWQANGQDTWGEIPDGTAPPSNHIWLTLNYTATAQQSVTFDKIVLYPRDSGTTQSYTVEISDDNLNWTKVIIAENTSPLTPIGTAFPHELGQVYTARYVRYVAVLATAGNTGLDAFMLFNK